MSIINNVCNDIFSTYLCVCARACVRACFVACKLSVATGLDSWDGEMASGSEKRRSSRNATEGTDSEEDTMYAWV